jgi:hypothetical protein
MATDNNPYLVNEKDLPKNLVPAEVEPSSAPAPPVPHDMPQFFSGSMPPQVQHDTQFVGTKLGTPRIPSYDLMPLGIQGNPSTNAAIQSTATKIVQNAIAAIPPADAGDVESIFTNVQAVTQYVVQVSDRVKLVSMNNNSGGTVVLPGGTLTKGTFEHAVTNNGNSVTASASGTPYTGGGIALLYAAADNAGTLQNPLTFTPGTWTKLYGPGGGDEQLYTTVMPSSATAISPSATVSPSSGWVTTLAFFQNTTAVSLVQRASGGGGGLGNGSFPIVFGSNITKGNSIIVFITAASYTFGASGYPTPSVPTDTQGNTYKLIAHVIEDLGTAPGNFSPQTWIWVAENAVGGANTTTVVLSGGSLGGSISATIYGYELALTGASTSTGFDNGWYCYIENTGSGTFNVVSAAQIDGVSGATISLGHNSGIIAAFDGTNWFTERGAGGGTSPQNTPAITHEVLTAYNSTTGAFTQAQLTQADIAAGAIANGSTATTQAAGDNTTDVATDAFVQTAVNNIISGTTPADGMRHGDAIWWDDSAYSVLRDDFFPYFANSANQTNLWQIGDLGWTLWGTVAINTTQLYGGAPPYIGQFSWENNGTVNNQAALLTNLFRGSGSAYQPNAMALLENPGWKATFVWKHEGPTTGTTNSFSTTKKAFYIGLTGATIGAVAGTNISARPDVFIGLRFDTSATPGTLTLSSVANASGGTTVYTGTITGGTSNAFIGITFVIAGFTTGANNGTFVCTASSATTLTLNNASGVAETHAATAAGGGLSDTFYTFEVVENQQLSTIVRHNAQGLTFVTNVSPTAGTWHRLDILCTATGVVTITLDGSGTNTHTFTVPQMTVTTSASGAVSTEAKVAKLVDVVQATGTGGAFPFATGSTITVSGGTGAFTIVNGTWTVTSLPDALNMYFAISTATNNAQTNQNITVVGYPALHPLMSFGNDDTAAPTTNSMRTVIDYFSLAWNKGIINPTNSPTATLARYW